MGDLRQGLPPYRHSNDSVTGQDLKNPQVRDGRESFNGDKLEQPVINVGGHGGTQRRLRNYQVTMIGFCSGIGTGLFVGTGAAYANAGPAGLLLAYSVVGSVLWCVMQSIAELATLVSRHFPNCICFLSWSLP